MNISTLVRGLPRPLRRHRLIRLFAGVTCPLTEFNGNAKFYADLHEPAARSVVISGEFEPEFFRLCAPFLANGGTFFDVGANLGLCSFGLMGAAFASPIRYHLFEANPRLCDLLHRSSGLYPDIEVTVNHCCVSDAPGRSSLRLAKESGQSWIAEGGQISVENLMLDEYIARHNIQRVELLKLDVEGYETRAVRGAEQSFKSGVVAAAYVEVVSAHLERAGSSSAELLGLLEDYGFVLYHCKAEDYAAFHRNSFSIGPAARERLIVNEQAMPVTAMVSANREYGRFQTDILAVHRSSGLVSAGAG